jgi:hypothetical protein
MDLKTRHRRRDLAAASLSVPIQPGLSSRAAMQPVGVAE